MIDDYLVLGIVSQANTFPPTAPPVYIVTLFYLKTQKNLLLHYQHLAKRRLQKIAIIRGDKNKGITFASSLDDKASQK